MLQQIKSNIYYNVIEEKGVFFLWFSLSDTPVYMDTLYHNHIHDENIDCGTIGKKDTTKRQKKKHVEVWISESVQSKKTKKHIVSKSDDWCDISISE